MKRLLCLFTILTVLIGGVSTAPAQEWGVKDNRQREIIQRYKILLERSPNEGLAFTKLLDYVGKGKGLTALVAEYEKKVEGAPDKSNFRLILGHLYKAKNEYESALEQYEAAVKLAPKKPLVWLSRGAIHLLLQHNKEASADFEMALSLEKDRSKKQDVLRKLADLAFAQRDWEAAQKYYDQLVDLDPKNEYLRLEYAQVLIKYKRYNKAEEQYNALIKLAGRDAKTKATTLRDLGDLYEKMGQDDRALETYEKAMKLVRSGNWLHRELRQRIVGVYRRSDRLGELIAVYSKKWRSPSYDQSMELAGLYDEVGDEDNALKYYRRASSKNRRSVDPRMKIVQVLERRGEDKAVIKAYQELIRIAPGQSRFRFELVRVHMRMGDRKKAEKVLRAVEGRHKRDSDVLVTLADAYMRYEMKEDALRVYKRLLRTEPKNDAYILGLGEYYFQNGELEKAVATWTKLLKSDLQEAEAQAKLGQVLAEHGMVDQGLMHFEKAVAAAPENDNIRRGLAMAYERARRWQKAVDTWRLILDRTEQPLAANEARGRIINIYRRQNRLRSKMREFQQSFDGKQDVSDGFFLAEANVKLGEFKEAELVFEKLAKMGRVDADKVRGKRVEKQALVSLEKLYQQTNAYEKGIVVLQRLAELMPEQSKDFYHRIAELSLRLYQDDQAVHYATLAVQLNPDDARAQARLGDIYFKMQRLESAVVQYRVAIDLDPRAFDIQVKLASILVDLGKFREAEALYRTITKTANDETLVLSAARESIALAEVDDRLEEVEGDFFPLVYRTPPRPVFRKIMLELYDRMTAPLIAEDRYGVDEVRASAEKRLQEVGQRALPVLVDSLQGGETGQRALAVRLLGDLRQGNGALALSRMVDDPKEPLRILAALAVAQIGDERAAEPLIRVTEDSDPTIRELAIWALGGVGGTQATKRLIMVLKEGQSWREQALASVSLGRIGGKLAAGAIIEFHKTLEASRYADYIGVSVVWAMGRTKDTRTVEALTHALTNSSPRVAAIAAWSLAEVGGEGALAGLLGAYWGDDYIARERAGRGLVLFASRDSDSEESSRRSTDEIRREIRLIEDRARVVRVEAMLKLLEEQATMVEVVDSSDFLVKEKATLTALIRDNLDLGRVVYSDLVSSSGDLQLGSLTIATDPIKVHGLMKEILGPLHPQLMKQAQTIKSPADAHILAVLGALGNPESREVIESHLGAPDPEIRALAVLALGGIADSSSKLNEALKDGNYEVRLAAIVAFGRQSRGSKAQGPADAVAKLLSDDYRSVQVESARALGLIGAPSSVSPLAKILLKSPVPVKTAALVSLRQIGTEEALRVVKKYQRHPDPRVRAAATSH